MLLNMECHLQKEIMFLLVCTVCYYHSCFRLHLDKASLCNNDKKKAFQYVLCVLRRLEMLRKMMKITYKF